MGIGSEIRDPGSGLRKKPIPDPGVKKAPDPGSATLNMTSVVDRHYVDADPDLDLDFPF
jgi:hypothetical protein